jgi:hypothetical protein
MMDLPFYLLGDPRRESKLNYKAEEIALAWILKWLSWPAMVLLQRGY